MYRSQYLRIEHLAGGCCCSHREFIRAARTLLSPAGKRRANRDFRHTWLRQGLTQLHSARDVYLGLGYGHREVRA